MIRSVCTPLILLLAAGVAQAAQDNGQPEKDLIVIRATSPLRPEELFLTPYSVETIDSDRIQNRQVARSMPDALKEVPGVSVQKTGPGQSSPFIRGLTGYRNLLLIDGIRLNNSVFRSGPNQYWATVDHFSIDRMELVRGTSSVLHGSDSLGGTLVVYTRGREKFGPDDPSTFRTVLRYAGAEASEFLRQEFEGHAGEFGWLVGVTGRKYGDIHGGPDVGKLPETGYTEYDADFKLTFPGENSRLDIGYQRVRQNDAPRVHRTVFAVPWRGSTMVSPTSTGSLFYDHDQERDLLYGTLYLEEAGIFDSVRLTVSGHVQAEKRDRIRASDLRVDVDTIRVATLGVIAHFGHETSAGHVTWGVDLYRDNVDSTRQRMPVGGPVADYGRGSVADDSTYDLWGVFIQDEIAVGEGAILTGGVRFTKAEVDAKGVAQGPASNDPFFLTLPPLKESYDAVVGNLKLLVELGEDWVGIVGISQGFRAPSLNDSTAIDDVGSGVLQVPALDLDPERTLQFEIGTRMRSETFALSAFAYYTILEDFISRVPTSAVGLPAGDVVLANFNDGFVQGVDLGATWQVTSEWEIYASAMWAFGNLDEPVSSGGVITGIPENPLSRVNPATGIVGARYQQKDSPVWIEGVVTVVRHQERLSASDKSDTQRIPPGGTPGYTILTLRGGVEISEHAKVTVSIENLTDLDYRQHGSGQNEPGTNAIVGVDLTY